MIPQDLQDYQMRLLIAEAEFWELEKLGMELQNITGSCSIFLLDNNNHLINKELPS